MTYKSSNNVRHPVTETNGPVSIRVSDHACLRYSSYKLNSSYIHNIRLLLPLEATDEYYE